MDISCEDEYEAQRLMWMLSLDRKECGLQHVATVSEKEIIIVLDDESSHSIVLLDKLSATRLHDVIQKIVVEDKEVKSIQAFGNTVYIDID